MPRTDSVSKQRSKSKGLSQYSTKPPKDPDFEMLKLSKIGATHGVVIAVDEVSSSTLALSAPPRAVLPRKQTPDPRPKQNPARASIDDVQGSKSQRTTTSRIAPLQSQSRPSSPVRGEASMHSQSSSTTLVRSDSNSSSTPRTPVMRSIFPRYNPSLPLAKQQYYPSVDRSLGPIIATNEASRSSAFSMSVYSQNEKSTPQLKPAMEGSSTSLAHEHTSPLQESKEAEPPPLSTPEDLLDLWSVANGQGSREAACPYNLKLEWYVNHPRRPSGQVLTITKLRFDGKSRSDNLHIISFTNPIYAGCLQRCSHHISVPPPQPYYYHSNRSAYAYRTEPNESTRRDHLPQTCGSHGARSVFCDSSESRV